MDYSCKTCGATVNTPGHLCNPCSEKVKCNFCGQDDVSARHMCTNKLAGMRFVCGECGRVADSPDHLCKPNQIIDHKSAF
ncbi:MAG: hypothetical protein VR64_12295 [Desulfatitalea sp. BRH_c12]|nr:MAG: hypothetical protein VR64_12295 [Desulfatitalea sp. BRH_c12]